MDHNKMWKILKEMGLPDHFPCVLRNPYFGQKPQLEPDMKSRTGSKYWERNTSRLYILTLLILLVCRVHYVKCMAGWITSWNQMLGEISINFLQPQGLQHARLPCPSPTLRASQTHVHQVGDAIQPSHPLLSPSLSALSSESVLRIRWPKY